MDPDSKIVEHWADGVEGHGAADEARRVQHPAVEKAGGGRKLLGSVVDGVTDFYFLHHCGDVADLIGAEADPGDDDPSVDGDGIDRALDEARHPDTLEDDIEGAVRRSRDRIVDRGGPERGGILPSGRGGIADDDLPSAQTTRAHVATAAPTLPPPMMSTRSSGDSSAAATAWRPTASGSTSAP